MRMTSEGGVECAPVSYITSISSGKDSKSAHHDKDDQARSIIEKIE
jgi:hypothetical protein